MSWDLDRDYVAGVFLDEDGSWEDVDHRIDNIMAALNHAYAERDRLRAELAQLRKAPEQNPHRCSDGGCLLLVPGAPVGMSTNGGCRCLHASPGADRARVRTGIRWLANRAGGGKT